jgi:hypothetical protein
MTKKTGLATWEVVEKQEEEEDDDEQEEEEELSYRTLPCWKLPQRNQVLKDAKSIITYTLMRYSTKEQ